MQSHKKRKVLYVITKSSWYGAQIYVYNLARALQKKYDVVVALGGSGLLKERLEKEGIRTVTVNNFMRDVNLFKEVRVLWELWKIYTSEKPDIVHLNSSKAAGLGAFLVRVYNILYILRRKIHSVFTVHGWAFTESRSFVARMLIAFFSWLTAIFAHDIIAISQATKRHASWMPFIQKKIKFIYNGITHIDFIERDSARKELRKNRIISKEALWIGTIGELHTNKGFDYLIDACKQLKDKGIMFTCMVIGEGEERERLETRIQENNLEDTVILRGYIPDAARYMKAFDVVTLTSRKEGLPTVLLEAGLASCACVATSVNGVPEIITHEVSGLLVPAHDTDAIYEAVKQLYDDSALRARFGEALQKDVEKRFRMGTMVEQTHHVYERI